MSYPTAPQSLVLAWENQLSLEMSPVNDRRNGGVELRGGNFQINRTQQIQDIAVNIVGRTNYLEIDNFFLFLNLRPFYFNTVLWQVQDWSWTFKQELVDNLSGGVYELSCRLTQVHRPGN